MKEVAPDSAAAGMGRVDRRITMLEKAFAEVVERHEKSLRERVGALSALEESLHALRNRVDQSEKHHTGAMMELRSALADACMRLNGVEAAQSPATEAAPAFSDRKQVLRELKEIAKILDRYTLSSLAYQGASISHEFIQAANRFARRLYSIEMPRSSSFFELSALTSARTGATVPSAAPPSGESPPPGRRCLRVWKNCGA